MNRILAMVGRSAATILIVILATLVAVWLWRHYERSPWTRDGRVRADVVRVTPDIGGLVTEVDVKDNQPVHAGQLLFVIDKPRYSLAVAQAQASVASAQATLGQAERTVKRDIALGDLVATETHEENVAAVATAHAALAEAQTALAGARLNLARTQVKASVNGIVTNLDLHPGDYVAAGQQAMALLDSDSLRVEGYFEETKLPLIRIGAPATVRLMGDSRPLYDYVESIAAGINDPSRTDASNLLPSVDATFTWVRLAQRIPVRIKLTRIPQGIRLVTGRTATVTIQPERAAPIPATRPTPAPAPSNGTQ
jgi:multidrug resistance efflux pump